MASNVQKENETKAKIICDALRGYTQSTRVQVGGTIVETRRPYSLNFPFNLKRNKTHFPLKT